MVIPKLRFKEFDGDWNNSSLLNLSFDKTLSNGVFNDQNKVGKGYKLINVLDMYIERDINESRLSLLDLSQQEFERNKVKYGDIFFTRSSLVKEGIAYSNVYLGSNNDITYDGHLIKLSPNLEQINPIFLNYGLKTSKVRKQLIQGGKTATMTTIGQKEIASTKIDIPLLKEQTKIATFLSAVDEKIAQLSQKLHLLGQYKQGMMQKLFSQQIRFKADDGSEFGELKIGKLGDMTSIQGGFAFKSTNFGKGITKVIRIGDIEKNINLNLFSGICSNEIPDTRYLISENAIVMALSGATFGKLGKVKQGSAYINQRVATFHVFEDSLNEFVYQIMLSQEFTTYIQSIPSASAQPNISNQDVINFDMLIPCLEEQTKIANFLSAIDQKMDVVSEQLKQAKTWKKGLLQQMFV